MNIHATGNLFADGRSAGARTRTVSLAAGKDSHV
jgi:hypothetical protein